MMRWLAPAVLGACQFAHGVLPADDATVAEPDTVHLRDASIDGMPTGPYVRRIDLDDSKITGGPHANFPLLVSLVEPWLRSRDNGGDVASADGLDIYFTVDPEGSARLAHEIEVYAADTGTLVAWVTVPSLVPESVVYLHYGDSTVMAPGNAAAVWSSGYALVMHLTGTADATGKNTPAVTGAMAAEGRIGGAYAFDGSSSRVALGSAAAIDNVFAGGGTAEAWFYADSFGEGSYGRFFDKGNQVGWSMFVNDEDLPRALGFVHGSGGAGWGQWNSPANSVTLGAWHHVALVFDKGSSANNPAIYIDGVAVAVTEYTTPSGAMDSDAQNDLFAGNRAALDRTFDGRLDEMRLSTVARSADWIATGYRNQSDPSTFYTVSAPLP